MQVERQAAFATLNSIYTNDDFPKFISNFTAAARRKQPLADATISWYRGVASTLTAAVSKEGLTPFKDLFAETYKPLLLCSVIRFIADSAGNKELSRKVSKLVFDEFLSQANDDHALSVVTIDPDFAIQNSKLVLPLITKSLSSDSLLEKLAAIFYRLPYFQKETADLHLTSAGGFPVVGHIAFLKKESSVIKACLEGSWKETAAGIPTIKLPEISQDTLIALVNFYERHKQFRATFSPEIWAAANFLDMEAAKEASRALILTNPTLMAQALSAAIMYNDRKLELHCFAHGALGTAVDSNVVQQALVKAYQLGFRVAFLGNGHLKLIAALTSEEHATSLRFMMKRYQFDVLEVLSLAGDKLKLSEIPIKRLILHTDAIEKKVDKKSLSSSMNTLSELTLVEDPEKDESDDDVIFDCPSLKKLTLCCKELHKFPFFEHQFKSMNFEEILIEADELYLSGQSYIDFQAFISASSSLKKVQIKTLSESTESNEIELLIGKCQQSASLVELVLDIGEFDSELFKKLLEVLDLKSTFDEKTNLYHIQLHNSTEAS